MCILILTRILAGFCDPWKGKWLKEINLISACPWPARRTSRFENHSFIQIFPFCMSVIIYWHNKRYLFICPWWIFLSNRMCGVLLCFQQGQRWSWYIFLGFNIWSTLNLSCSLPSSMDYLWRWATNHHIVSTFFDKIPYNCCKNVCNMLEFETIILGLQAQQWDKTPVMEEIMMRGTACWEWHPLP